MILATLEDFLNTAVDAALPNNVDASVGPWAAADGVYVHARTLVLEPPGDEPPEDAEGHLLSVHEWPADGVTLDFELPPGLDGELIDVEAPVGYLAARGDHYYVEDRRVRFYRPPAAADPGVRARVQGSAARGYRRRRGCRVVLELSAVDQDLADADAWLETALQVALTRLIDLPLLTSAAQPGVHMRVDIARSEVERVERERVEGSNRLRATARLELRGELELLVASGEPEPTGTIEGIAGTVEVAGKQGEFSFGGTAVTLMAGPGPRAIEGEPVTRLSGLGSVGQGQLAALDPPVTALGELVQLDVDAHAGSLTNPAAVRSWAHKAKLVLAAFGSGLPAMPPQAEARPLDQLLSMSLVELSGLIDQQVGYAVALRDELLTLELMLTSSALGSLTLAHFR